jgi:hypothetical protein|tara:strand:- start:354 stop:620 length:267 start_codon:yes stop_codon:yes gene_type:complete
MTKIYIYCLFDQDDLFRGVYSSLKAVHRDALKIANTSGRSQIFMETQEGMIPPTLTDLRNVFKGKCDVVVRYRSGRHVAKVIKTKLKE